MRLKKLSVQKESNAKRFGIFPVINNIFSRHDVLDKLDECLIPETWGTRLRVEHIRNVQRIKNSVQKARK